MDELEARTMIICAGIAAGCTGPMIKGLLDLALGSPEITVTGWNPVDPPSVAREKCKEEWVKGWRAAKLMYEPLPTVTNEPATHYTVTPKDFGKTAKRFLEDRFPKQADVSFRAGWHAAANAFQDMK